MDSRPILKNVKKIRVHLDSNTFNDLLNQKDRLVIAILRYHDSDLLDFVRSPLKTVHKDLEKITEYEVILEPETKFIRIKKEGSMEEMAFYESIDHILSISEQVYKKDKITEEELNRIMTVFVQAVFNRFEKTNIYITNEKILLKNRFWFESYYPGYPLNIMSVEEASIFLDLFFKMNGKFCVSGRHTLNKGYWYWLSMRLKIPHYNVGDTMIDALAHRLCYALMALDEMGIQYYLGIDSDTMDNTLYHFNYLITLITGIFDNIALKTNTYLSINFQDLRKVSLSNKSGKEFLIEIREKNPDIREHIISYSNFIRLIYSFRKLVIHREGLSTAGGYIKISEEIKKNIDHCSDENSEYDSFSKWGVYRIHDDSYLVPYQFSLTAINMLIRFVDKCLELLGYPSFIETQKQKGDDFPRTLKFYEKYHLGF